MSDVTIHSTAAQMSEALIAGSTTSVALTNSHFAQIEAVEPAVHAFLHLDKDGALSQAAEVDAKRARGEKLAPLAGVPLALKDVLAQQGVGDESHVSRKRRASRVAAAALSQRSQPYSPQLWAAVRRSRRRVNRWIRARSVVPDRSGMTSPWLSQSAPNIGMLMSPPLVSTGNVSS